VTDFSVPDSPATNPPGFFQSHLTGPIMLNSQASAMYHPGAAMGMGGPMHPGHPGFAALRQPFPTMLNPLEDANKDIPSVTEEGGHLMSVCLCNNQLLAKYPKLVLTKHSAAMTNQPTTISFSPFLVKLKYNFPNLSPPEKLRLSLEVKMGNKELMVKCHNREIDIKRQMNTIILTIKEHSIALPHPDSWKKLNPRADGIKQNVQGFVRKLRLLEVSFIDGPHQYVFSTQVICCAATSFQNALKTYRDNEQSQQELLDFIAHLPAPKLAIRNANAVFAKLSQQPTIAGLETQGNPLKRARTNGMQTGPLWDWWNSAPTVHNIEQFFASAPWWTALFQKNWEGVIRFFHDHIGEPTIAKIIQEITTLFTPEYFFANVRFTCESQYFGGLVDPRRVVAQMKLAMMEDVTLYPDGCVIFVIWKRETEKNYYYYLIESPYWDVVQRKFAQTSAGEHRDQKFPCSIRKFQIFGEQKLGLVSRQQQTIRQGQSINISYITECWGSAPLTAFQIREDAWGQNSSEFLPNLLLRTRPIVSSGEQPMVEESGGQGTIYITDPYPQPTQGQGNLGFGGLMGMKPDPVEDGRYDMEGDQYWTPDLDWEYNDGDQGMAFAGTNEGERFDM